MNPSTEIGLIIYKNGMLINPHSHNRDTGKTLLHEAAQEDDIELMHFLVQHHAHVDAQDFKGNTPLHCAAARNKVDAVWFLVNYCNANPIAKNSAGKTPLDKEMKCKYKEQQAKESSLLQIRNHKAMLRKLLEPLYYAQEQYEQEQKEIASFCILSAKAHEQRYMEKLFSKRC